jgi:hypothetical protein
MAAPAESSGMFSHHRRANVKQVLKPESIVIYLIHESLYNDAFILPTELEY